MKLQFVILIIMFIFVLVSCKKDDDSKTNDSNGIPFHEYTSEVLIEGYPPLMGGCLDTNGMLITFQKPLFVMDPNFNDILINAKILRLEDGNVLSTLYDFGNETFIAGAYIGYIVGNLQGKVPHGVRSDLLCNQEGEIFISASCYNNIRKISGNTISSVVELGSIIAITGNGNNGFFAISSPIFKDYSGNIHLLQAPRIYLIDSLYNQEVFFEFPENIQYEYNYGLSGSNQGLIPIDIYINLEKDNSDNLYVSFGYNDVIYRIDKNKGFTEFINDIHCPVSFTIDDFQRMFIVSAPLLEISNTGYYKMIKPVEVYLVDQSGREIIYKEELQPLKKWVKNDSIIYEYTPGNNNYNITVDKNNIIYLEDPTKGRIIAIK